MEYNRNFYIAIILSFGLIFVWQIFFVTPQNKQQEVEQQTAQQIQQSADSTVPNAPANQAGTLPQAGQAAPNTMIDMTPPQRQAALQKNDRVEIDTPEIKGSINLVGAQFDDVLLKKYRMTVDKDSPEIALLNPDGFKESYLAEFGFSDTTKLGLKLPQLNTKWEIEGDNKLLSTGKDVTLVYDNGDGLVFRRKIAVDEHYMFTITDTVTNNSTNTVSFSPYARVARASPPEQTSASYILHEGMIGVTGDGSNVQESYKDMAKLEDGQTTKTQVFADNQGGWIGITDKYWAVAAIPDQKETYTSRFVYDSRFNTHYQSDILGKVFPLAAGQSQTFTNRLFVGAKQVDILNHYQDDLGISKLGLLIDWGKYMALLSKPMFTLIDFFYKYTGNFGIAILLVTVLLKAILFPLANKSYKSMARMKVVQPRMLEIREKYSDDRTKMQQATMELYKTEKINPLAGCWPLLIQMPIFFALYKVLYITIEMRHAPFFGWIHDLAAPDPTSVFNLFGLLPYNVPAFLMIGAWPLLMGITMFLQMRMNPTPPDPTQAMIFTWMPVVFTYMLHTFPAGLVIYWAWNNTLSIIQQGIMMKRHGAKIELWGNLKSLFQKKTKPEAK